MSLGKFLVIVIAVMAVVAVFNKRDDRSAEATKALAAEFPGAPKTAVPAATWSYSISEDPMGKGSSHTARIASVSPLNLAFPYQTTAHPILMLRLHPSYGKDVILQIAKGQLMCGYPSCSVTVRFDDEPAQQWPATRSSDSDSTVLFLGKFDSFAKKVATSTRVRIQPTIYQAGNPVIEFPIAGFEPAKFRGK